MSKIADLAIPTEEKIRLAAIRVFTHKGYDGTKTRDIAEVAGINVATLHYYHRRKEQLFELVAHDMMAQMVTIHEEVFTPDRPLQEKIVTFVDRYTDLLAQQPDLALFCVAESERNPEAFTNRLDFNVPSQVLKLQLEALIEQGEIRPISTQMFVNALVGMTIYPFLTRTTITHTVGLDDASFRQMLAEQKRVIPEMIMRYLYV